MAMDNEKFRFSHGSSYFIALIVSPHEKCILYTDYSKICSLQELKFEIPTKHNERPKVIDEGDKLNLDFVIGDRNNDNTVSKYPIFRLNCPVDGAQAGECGRKYKVKRKGKMIRFTISEVKKSGNYTLELKNKTESVTITKQVKVLVVKYSL